MKILFNAKFENNCFQFISDNVLADNMCTLGNGLDN